METREVRSLWLTTPRNSARSSSSGIRSCMVTTTDSTSTENNMNIEQLAPQVAAQIAAGEVIERPASVVKELVENSIDADATKIIVEIKGSGVEQIRVSDNGSGIPADELSLAFQRHTTSKLRNAEDLQTITTLGFRGEALPSIASVSIVECHSRTPNTEAGTRICMKHGSMQGPPQAYGCPVGTTFQISDLFSNTPVRKKFLRTRNTELNHIQQAVARYAMAQPGIKFLLITDSRNTLETPGSGRLIETILALYDVETAKNMLELSLEREDIKIRGYTANREAHRGSRAEITTLVNGRWIRDSNLAYAVEQAYDKTLPPHRHPISVIDIEIPGHLVDINAHPTKQEVRFKNSNKVFGAVKQAIEQALLEHSPIQHIQPPLRSQAQTSPRLPPLEAMNPAWLEPGPSLSPETPLTETPTETPTGNEQSQSRRFPASESQGRLTDPEPEAQPTWQPDQTLSITLRQLRVLGQSANTYIVADHPNGLCLLDQHAAHERVLYDNLQADAKKGHAKAQRMLIPITTTLSPEQSDMTREYSELLERYGFTITPGENDEWTISTVPAVMNNLAGNPEGMLTNLLDELVFETLTTEVEKALAATMACHSAVRAGDHLTLEEMESIIQQLAYTHDPHTCPHGRPTSLQLKNSHIETEFRRR